MAPIIGVTATLKADVDSVAERPLGKYVRADLDYVEGVAAAGGVPVVLPPNGDARAAEAVIHSLDGLLLSGGSDLDPGYYDELPAPELGPTIPERDAFEMPLLDLALRRGLPILGICRGMQLLNVPGWDALPGPTIAVGPGRLEAPAGDAQVAADARSRAP